MEQKPTYCPPRTSLNYIECSINNHPFRALVDMASEISIIDLKAARECNLESEVMAPCIKKATGMGRTKTVGFIPCRKIKIGRKTYDVNLTVIDGFAVDLLLGLDFLEQHDCDILLTEKILSLGEHQVKLIK